MDGLVFSSYINAPNDLWPWFDFIYGHQNLKQGKIIREMFAVI